MKRTWMVVTAFIVLCSCHSNSNSTPDSVQAAGDSNAAHAGNSPDSAMISGSRDDASFLVEACAGSKMEVRLGKIAESNSRDARVRAFGRMMVRDHTKGENEIKKLAKQKNITLSDSLTSKEQQEVEKLRGKKGAEFDRDYINAMVDDHQDDIKAFQDESTGGSDADIKSLASGSLPMLNVHLDSAQSIQKSIQP